jgi:signal transduction histidine kinase
MPPRIRRKRQRSIRVLLTAIFIVPLVSLLGLWAFAASVTVSNAIQEHNFTHEDQLYGGWAQSIFTELAQERLLAYEWLSGGHRGSDSAYVKQQQATDNALAEFRRGIDSGPLIVASARPALNNFNSQLSRLIQLRKLVGAGTVPALTAFNDYNQIVDSEFNLYSDLVVVNNTSLYMQAAASVEAGRAVELASREVTLVTGAVMIGGRMDKPERVLFAQMAANRQYLMAEALRRMDPSLGSGFQRADASSAYKDFTRLETGIVNSIGSKTPVPGALAFDIAAAKLFTEYQQAEAQDRVSLSSLGTQVGNHLLWEVGLAGGIGLLAVILSVFLMLRFGRRISRDLTGLQHAALDLAETRLPDVVARLSRGEDVDIAAEAAPPAEGRIAETAQVAAAFSSVQRTAVEAAVGQARLRAGVAQVFRNLAWRSQSLLHRQLTLLDGMERRSSEPDTLEELFQLDHLTTRMRRHAEGLIILSGATPGRGWREPVPIMDVLRGAIAEVEDYKRVTVLCESQDAVLGSAVADVIHLLAELIENATTYSPASTEVTIRAERVANGFAVEIEDRGIGISPEETATYNERLANPPEFDIADSDQLGLFVVARLAGKHHVRITLRPSPFGGTSAVVLLPHQVVVVNEAGGTLTTGVRVVGNGRELISSGRELPAARHDRGGTGWELAAASAQGPAGNGRGDERDGREADDDGPEPAAEGASPATAGLGPATAGIGPATADIERALADIGPAQAPSGLASSGLEGIGNGGERQGNGWELAGPGAYGRPGDAGPFDVFRTRLPEPPASGGPEPEPANGSGDPAPTVSSRRLDPYGTGGAGSPWADPPGLNTSAPAEPEKPWLPRRVRQASLAPQLRTEMPAMAEDTGATAGEDEGGGADSVDGPNPADTRALVQSLQFGLELARATDAPADDSWPSPADESWSPSADEPRPSPAGNADLASWPDDDRGQ